MKTKHSSEPDTTEFNPFHVEPRRVNKQEARRLLRRYHQSGKTLSHFCASQGVSFTQLRSWFGRFTLEKRKRVEIVQQKEDESSFVRVHIKNDDTVSSHDTSLDITLQGQRKIYTESKLQNVFEGSIPKQ